MSKTRASLHRGDSKAVGARGTIQVGRRIDPQPISSIRELGRLDTDRRDGPKVGRNEPCPCGSGKKAKRCCAGARRDLTDGITAATSNDITIRVGE